MIFKNTEIRETGQDFFFVFKRLSLFVSFFFFVMFILFIVYHWFWTWRSLSLNQTDASLHSVTVQTREMIAVGRRRTRRQSNSFYDAMFAHSTGEWRQTVRQTDRLEY